MNEGHCSAPDICNCTSQWIGEQCEIGTIIVFNDSKQVIFFLTAICSEGFCMNGGNCSYPDVNCTCTPNQWEGDQCEIGNCSINGLLHNALFIVLHC